MTDWGNIKLDGAGRAWREHEMGRRWTEPFPPIVETKPIAKKPAKKTPQDSVRFFPAFREIGSIPYKEEHLSVSQETMLFRASLDFAKEHGGGITRHFLGTISGWISAEDSIPEHTNVLVDVRVHQLRFGQYPCVPGWHLDFSEEEITDLDAIPQTTHFIVVVGETSLPEFVDQPISLKNVEPPNTLKKLNDQIKAINPKTFQVRSGQIVRFTGRDWHRGTPAKGKETRLMIRASIVDEEPSNEIRTQTQVYLPADEGVW